MKIKACNKITKMWKMAQADPAITWPTNPNRYKSKLNVHTLPSNAISRKTNSPAYILPNSRIPKETPLARYSMIFKGVSLGMRLFGNMYAAELVFLLIALLGSVWTFNLDLTLLGLLIQQ